jgi:hypothetical protein
MPRKPSKPKTVKPAKTVDTAPVAAPSKTLTTLLLDRSGSMSGLHAQTIAGINGWLEELRGSGEDIRLSLVQFDHAHGAMQLEKLHVARRIAEVPDLVAADFQPRGGTPLIDAAMETISAIRASLEGRTGVKVVVAIQTDGMENNSVRFRWDDLRAEIAAREADGWEFVFMGAGLGRSTYDMGARMGVSEEKILSYGKDMAETRAAFRSTGRNTALYASGAMESMAYSSAQKTASGDVFEGEAGKAAPAGGSLSGRHVAASVSLGLARMMGLKKTFSAGKFPSAPSKSLDLSFEEDHAAHAGLPGDTHGLRTAMTKALDSEVPS